MNPNDSENERKAAIDQVEALVKQHNITAEELFGTAVAVQPSTQTVEVPQEKPREHLSVSETLYNIGALIILSGAWALVGINWGTMDDFGKIFSSLAVVVFTYLLAIGVSKVKVLENVSPALYLAALGTVPVVVIAIINATIPDLSGPAYLLLVALFSGLVSVIGWLFHRIAVFVLGEIVYASLAYFALVQMMLEALPPEASNSDELAVGSFVLLGLVYIALGFIATRYVTLLTIFKNALYGFGALFIFGSLFTQTGWSSDEVTIMGVLYPVLVFVGIIASALLKQPSILLVATVSLSIYLIKTTFMYFSDNLGWPFALMLSGILTIAIGIGANLLAKRLGLTKNRK